MCSAQTSLQITWGTRVWDVPVYTEHTTIKANRVVTQFVDHMNKVWTVQTSCPEMEHLEMKSEKTMKYVQASAVWAEEAVP